MPCHLCVYYLCLLSWIESVHLFNLNFFESGTYFAQADIARFSIPARSGPGDYIVWFQWQGYTDCVDVNVIPGTVDVSNRYGLNATFVKPQVIKMVTHTHTHTLIDCGNTTSGVLLSESYIRGLTLFV